MTERGLKKRPLAVLLSCVLAVAAAALLSACGGSSSSSGSSTSESGGATSTSNEAPSSGSDVARAKDAIAPYAGQPSPLPVTEMLKELPKGATFAYMDCGAPFCSLFYQLLEPAAKAMGVKLERIKAGSAANTVSEAFDTVVSTKPAAVIVAGIPAELWTRQLKELQEEDVKVVTTGINGLEGEEGVSSQAAEALDEHIGKALAGYVATEFGNESNIAFYNIPELSFTAGIAESFQAELAEVCSGCKSRESPVAIATLGNTAPQTIVSDLQANPETTVAVFPSSDMELGLPSALKAAGIDVKTLVVAPEPSELQYLKEGKMTSAFAADAPILAWTMVDAAARLIAGQEITGAESEGLEVNQFLTQKDITFDPAKGWNGDPDYAQEFEKLWGVG